MSGFDEEVENGKNKELPVSFFLADMNSLKQTLQQYATLYEGLAQSIKPLQANSAFSELAKRASLYQSAFSAIKSLQANGAFSELTKQFSANKKMSESSDEPE